MLAASCAEFVDVATLLMDEDLILDPKEQKRREHRIGMVAFRRKRKAKQSALREERCRLEDQLKQIEATVRAAASRTSAAACEPPTTQDKLHELVVEIDALRQQNVAIQKHIKVHREFQQVLEDLDFSQQDEEFILPVIDELSGWRVSFPDGEPSFHFHPFTRQDFDSTVDLCSVDVSSSPCAVNLAREFLGWNVCHATATSVENNGSLVAKARFTKRIHCSVEIANEAMRKERRDEWPIIITPMKWGGSSSGRATTLVLQQFDNNTSVLVTNIHGRVNLRYICLAHRHRWRTPGVDGKRTVTYTMVIADSEANKRSRTAEANEDEVEWVTEGGTQLTITEVDDGTIDVAYDHWGVCQGNLHAQYLFVQWAHYALCWEQMVVPSRLLSEQA
ncbi:uncharacterized protein IUM83_10622 [Phytophthora cinnamomi]|uniref:uncharacterized protein n=1 Tax=Phytophthora cinnamomi TaxID=4785 RepID=UPI00355A7362|nr:hypothetical protein IUM83_10622 [Phytophthora cinnamomi]